jgi:CDP-paratose 2-epimerase
MNWLITGGCGFIGSNLANTLLDGGNEVVIVDNLSRHGSRLNLEWLRSRHGSGWRFMEADTRDAAAIEKIVAETKPNAIAHLAGQVAATASLKDPRMDFEVNALGALNVLEAARLRHPEAVLLFSSTNKVYGPLDKIKYRETDTRYVAVGFENGFDELVCLDGSTPYGCSKLTADTYFKDYWRVFGLRTIVFRHSSMYGGRQFATFDQGWVGWFCQKALEMQDPNVPQIEIAGDGKQVRDLLYSADLVSCYIKAANSIERCAGEVFNIGGGMDNSLSLRELFSSLERHTGAPMRYRQGAWRIADQKVFVANTQKAFEYFGWEPEVTAESGLERMLTWCRQVA